MFHMRYDQEHKARMHRKIVRSASRQLRAKGLNGPGVAALMKASGLTHGGFYKHFHSKEDLLVQAIEESFSENRKDLLDAMKAAPAGEGWKAAVRYYLSPEHCDQAGTGCPVAALAPEIARMAPRGKKRIAGTMMDHRSEMLPWMPGKTQAEKDRNFLVIFSTLLGAVSFVRMLPDAGTRRKMLAPIEEYLLSNF